MNKLTTNQVANMSGLSPSGVRKQVKKGELKAQTIPYPVSEGGEQYRYDPLDVLEFLEHKYHEKKLKYNKLGVQINRITDSIMELRRVRDEKETTAIHE